MKAFLAYATVSSLLTFSVSASEGVKVHAEIDSAVVEMADVTHMRLKVEAPTSATGLRIVPMPEEGTELEGVDIVGIKIDTIRDIPGKQAYEYDFTIQPFNPGMVTFQPFGVIYGEGGDTTFTDVLTLKVNPVDVDSLETINPMAEIADAQNKWYDYIPDWTLWVLLGLALAGIGVTLAFYFLRRRTRAITKEETPIPPYELAKMRLNSLASQKLAENGMEKAYYTELVDILREYLEGRFGINAMEMTSDQIIRAIRHNNEIRLSAEGMKTLLEIADFVKFAKVRPLPDDNRRSFLWALDFVETTKPLENTESEVKKEK